VAQQQPEQITGFSLEKVYIKDLSFESPGAPKVFFSKENAPGIGVQLSLSYGQLNKEQNLYEVVLSLTITAKTREGDNTVFLIEIQQAGVFRIEGFREVDIEPLIDIECAHILFPFAREAINDIVSKGGYPQLLISPINFQMLHEQKTQQKSQAQ
jgi:preprotein translocase subunit SecB